MYKPIFNKRRVLKFTHFTNKGYADVNVIRAEASAACEVLFDLYKRMGVPVEGDAAVCIYTGVVTDTGNLTYSNTTPHAIRIVAELLENGLNITQINRYISRTVPSGKMYRVSPSRSDRRIREMSTLWSPTFWISIQSQGSPLGAEISFSAVMISLMRTSPWP